MLDRRIRAASLAEPPADARPARPYPLWARLAASAFVAVLVPVYWYHYGPVNFLWFSDIALFAVLLTLWTCWRLPYSMMAVGVLPLEMVWLIDFVAIGNTTGMAAYMFEDDSPLHLRALSLFHLFLPPLIVWMLIRQGYDTRALPAQVALAWIVLPLSWLLSTPDDNVNWVHGIGPEQQTPGSPLYLGTYMLLLPALYLPMHWLLKKVTAARRPAAS